MKKITFLTLILMLLFAAACSSTQSGEPSAEETSQPGDTGGTGGTGGTGSRPTNSTAELIAALRQDGATVEESTTAVENPFFEVDAQLITVNGAEVQVYQFADEAARQTAQDTVNATGNIIGSISVDWMEEPHFFGAGRLIALYVGDDQAILDLLSGRLGQPFTAGGGGFMVPDSPAVEAALNTLSQELAAAAADFSVTSVEEMDWSDSCLGLGGPEESCLQAITPGFQIMVQMGDRQFEVRTDETGQVVRWQEIE
jgi:hypothetical protein